MSSASTCRLADVVAHMHARRGRVSCRRVGRDHACDLRAEHGISQ